MPTITPRIDLGLPARVTNTNRITARRALARNLGMIVVHYTGNARSYASADLAKSVQSIHRWRANEYNYVIHADGRIAEFAGAYQAAHCAGRNATSYGVLFLNGVDDPCTDAQVASFRWLVDVLKWTQAVAPGVRIAQHGQVAATACPGPIKARWTELVA
jgi:N-acetyl-anhydromuramyl-L-alanine amidase AmpD